MLSMPHTQEYRQPGHREFSPTDLPTANGSYSPFQRLGSPRENVSR